MRHGVNHGNDTLFQSPKVIIMLFERIRYRFEEMVRCGKKLIFLEEIRMNQHAIVNQFMKLSES